MREVSVPVILGVAVTEVEFHNGGMGVEEKNNRTVLYVDTVKSGQGKAKGFLKGEWLPPEAEEIDPLVKLGVEIMRRVVRGIAELRRKVDVRRI